MLHVGKTSCEALENYKRNKDESFFEQSGNKQYKDFYAKGKKKRFRDLCEDLLKDQHSLCCYCMRIIKQKEEHGNIAVKLSVEHFLSKYDYKSEALNYSNLFGSCSFGKHAKGREVGSCDNYKGGENFKSILNPSLDKVDFYEHMKLTFVSVNKYLYIKSGDTGVDKELDEILNLNIEDLCSSRYTVFNTVRNQMKGKTQTELEGAYRRFITMWKEEHAAAQFFNVIVYLFEHILLESSPNYGKKFLNPHYI